MVRPRPAPRPAHGPLATGPRSTATSLCAGKRMEAATGIDRVHRHPPARRISSHHDYRTPALRSRQEPSPNRTRSNPRRRNGKAASPTDSRKPRCSPRSGSNPNSRTRRGPNPHPRPPAPTRCPAVNGIPVAVGSPDHSSFRSADCRVITHRGLLRSLLAIWPDPDLDSSYPRSHR